MLLDVSRKENKYLVSTQTASRTNALLSQTIKSDPNNGPNGYMVRSLYFDTPYDEDYQEKVDGLLYRKKVRLRIYSPTDDYAKLELKEKINTNQRKRSLTITRADALRLISGQYSCLLSYQSKFAQEMYLLMSLKHYIPKCIVEYRRNAFIVEENNTRITLDANLLATESDYSLFKDKLFLYPVTQPDSVTLEVKYNHFLLSYVKDLLWLHNSLPISNSKYILSRSVGHGNINSYV